MLDTVGKLSDALLLMRIVVCCWNICLSQCSSCHVFVITLVVLNYFSCV